MGRDVKDINPFWHILCAMLVMACNSDEEPSKPLDIVTIKRTSANRSTTSTPGPTRWEIAKRK